MNDSASIVALKVTPDMATHLASYAVNVLPTIEMLDA